MTSAKLVPLTNRAAPDSRTPFQMPADGWTQLAPIGSFPHPSGVVQVIDAKAVESMVGRFNSEMPGGYAQASKINLSGITEPLRTARILAKKAGRDEATADDLRTVIQQTRLPMDCILDADPASLCVSEDSQPPRPKRQRRTVAATPRTSRVPSAIDEAEEAEGSESEVLPRQVHPRAVALSPVVR